MKEEKKITQFGGGEDRGRLTKKPRGERDVWGEDL